MSGPRKRARQHLTHDSLTNMLENHYTPNQRLGITKVVTNADYKELLNKYCDDPTLNYLSYGYTLGNILHLAKLRMARTANTRAKGVFVRKKYVDMFKDELVNLMEAALDGNEEEQKMIGITGTPQIGKSMFISYLLMFAPEELKLDMIFIVSQRVQKLQDGKKVVKKTTYSVNVLLFPNKGNPEKGKIYMHVDRFTSLQLETTTDFRAIIDTIKREYPGTRTAVFADGLAQSGEADLFDCFVEFTSQSAIEGDIGNAITSEEYDWLFMPVWTQEELEEYHDEAETHGLRELKVSIKSAMEWFGGVMGLLFRDEQDQIERVYGTYVEQHITKVGETNALSPMNARAKAALIKFKLPYDRNSKSNREFITPRIREAIRWETKKTKGRLYKKLMDTEEGAVLGWMFERYCSGYFFYSYEPVRLNLKDIEDLASQTAEDIEMKCNEVPRLIHAGGNNYSLRYNCVHVLSTNAKAIDFYVIQAADATEYAKVYFIQATVGVSHNAVGQKDVDYYMRKLSTAQKKLQDIRGAIANNNQQEIDEYRRRDGVMKYFAEMDQNMDLEEDVYGDEVEIWILYLQKEENTEYTLKKGAKYKSLEDYVQIKYAYVDDIEVY